MDTETEKETLEDRLRGSEKENQRLTRTNQKLEREVRDLLTIGQAVRLITSSLNIEDILRNVLNAISNVLCMERVLLCLVNSDRKVEEVKVAVGIDDIELADATWKIHSQDRVWTELQEKRVPLLIRPSQEDSLPEFVRQIFDGPFVKAPIAAKGQIIGTIMGYRSKGKTSERDLRLLQIFTEYAAIAIENGRLYYDVIKSEGALRQAQNQLIEAERMAVIGQVAVSINHEINNPLSNISLIAQTVLKDPEKKEPELAALLQEIETNVERIRRVARKISELKNVTPTEYLPDQLMINLS